MKSERSHLDWLESEAIYILREVAGESANPVLFFSGGKDSICLLRLAEKAFRPGRNAFSARRSSTMESLPPEKNSTGLAASPATSRRM